MVVGYGKRIMDMTRAAKRKTTKRYKCPSCSRVSVKRLSSGVWECRKCSAKFASDAYEFKEERT